MYQDEEKDRDFGGPDAVPDVDVPDDTEEDTGVDVLPEPEPEPAPEPRAHEKETKPKRDPLKTKFNQVMRDKERAYETINRLQEENEKLRREREIASQTAVRNYEDNVTQRLANAERLKVEAYDSGDSEAIKEADKQLTRAIYDSEKLNDLKAQQEFSARQQAEAPQPQAPQYAPQDIYAANPEPYQEWLAENDWMSDGSPNYDAEMAYQMNLYTQQLNHRILASGISPEEVDPDEYLGIVNNHAAALEARRQAEYSYQQRNRPQERQTYAEPQQRRELNMRPSRQPVSPVRGQRSNGNAGRPQLTKEQADMASYFARADKSVDLKTYAKAAQQDRAVNPHRYNNGGY